MEEPTAEEIRRFWQKVSYSPEGCWEWTGAKANYGYGLVRISGKWQRAHRVSWVLWNGAIPEGLKVCHSCDNPPCCNPAHLFLGTQPDNLADMTAKGRRASGERHPWHGQNQSGETNHAARLTAANVADIRAMGLAGYQDREIAARFGVNRATVSYVLLGKTWIGIEPSAALPKVERLSYRAKLTPEQAREIRSKYRGRGDFGRLGTEYGVSRGAIREIIRGRSYRED